MHNELQGNPGIFLRKKPEITPIRNEDFVNTVNKGAVRTSPRGRGPLLREKLADAHPGNGRIG